MLLRLRVVDGVYDALIAGHEQHAVMTRDVGDHEAGKMEAMFGEQRLQRALQLGFTFPKLVEAELFDLGDADVPAVFLEDLAVAFERTFWRLLAQHGTGGEEIFDELGAVDAADASEPFKNLFIRTRRRGAGEVQRVGDDTRAKANGCAFLRCGFLHAVHDANDGRSTCRPAR